MITLEERIALEMTVYQNLCKNIVFNKYFKKYVLNIY